MEWVDASIENCPVSAAVEIIGERWTLLIVRDALNGIHRFEDFRAHLGVSDAVLADRLRKLVDAGVLERRPYREAGRRTRDEYHPTRRGSELMTVTAALRQWGADHLADVAAPAFVARHQGCGGTVSVELRCTQHADETLSPDEVHVVPGPAARPADRLLPSRLSEGPTGTRDDHA